MRKDGSSGPATRTTTARGIRTDSDEIPLLARIVSCCDAFKPMTSDRSYRKAMPLEDAIAELRRVRGAQFDPQVVDALIEAAGDGVAEAQIENVA
jgi:HD-GYP domain-containing protein (c-di-GMP phosphodiesterase class II)